MHTITILLSMVSAGSLTLGIIHLRLWLPERYRLDRLVFAILCLSVVTFSWLEIVLFHADSPQMYARIVRMIQLPSFVALISAALFVHANLGTGRRWLLRTFIFLRIATLIINFAVLPNINFRLISAIGQTTVLGEAVAYPIGAWNPWALIPQVSLVLLIIYCLDASITRWRAGMGKQAAIIGGGVTLFAMTSLTMTLLVTSGQFQLPLIVSPGLLFVTAAMGYELNRDIHRSAMIAKQLIESESELNEIVKQLNLSASAANVGIWTRNIGESTISASEKMREMFGFSGSRPLSLEDCMQRVHPDDRDRFARALDAAEGSGSEFNFEYRLLLDDLKVRWIESRGKIEFEDGRPTFVRGVSVDITQRKLAEEAAHELSRKLINAQEKERARLARELHDDLSQRLALLSIHLAEIRRDSIDPNLLKSKVDDLSSQIQKISSDIHRMSHELHPAKLDQLGLESALRGFCRELEAAHHIKISLETENVPRALPREISLCLYRVSQEAVQNVIKHSGASSVNLSVRRLNGEIKLDVTDNGSGFDPKTVRGKESLGLISIDERIRAVNGVVKIDSSIGSGTHIEARVPIEHELG